MQELAILWNERRREREKRKTGHGTFFIKWPVVRIIEIDSIWIFMMHSLFPYHACALIMITLGIVIGFPFHDFFFLIFISFSLIFISFSLILISRSWTNSFSAACMHQPNRTFTQCCYENRFYAISKSHFFFQHFCCLFCMCKLLLSHNMWPKLLKYHHGYQFSTKMPRICIEDRPHFNFDALLSIFIVSCSK